MLWSSLNGEADQGLDLETIVAYQDRCSSQAANRKNTTQGLAWIQFFNNIDGRQKGFKDFSDATQSLKTIDTWENSDDG